MYVLILGGNPLIMYTYIKLLYCMIVYFKYLKLLIVNYDSVMLKQTKKQNKGHSCINIWILRHNLKKPMLDVLAKFGLKFADPLQGKLHSREKQSSTGL